MYKRGGNLTWDVKVNRVNQIEDRTSINHAAKKSLEPFLFFSSGFMEKFKFGVGKNGRFANRVGRIIRFPVCFADSTWSNRMKVNCELIRVKRLMVGDLHVLNVNNFDFVRCEILCSIEPNLCYVNAFFYNAPLAF